MESYITILYFLLICIVLYTLSGKLILRGGIQTGGSQGEVPNDPDQVLGWDSAAQHHTSTQVRLRHTVHLRTIFSAVIYNTIQYNTMQKIQYNTIPPHGFSVHPPGPQ